MAFCPSQAWDAHCDSQEIPETCPVCGKTNHDEETGAPVYEADWAFCSSECHTAYNVTEKAAFAALGKDY
mgnify:CR=1 FL=1